MINLRYVALGQVAPKQIDAHPRPMAAG